MFQKDLDLYFPTAVVPGVFPGPGRPEPCPGRPEPCSGGPGATRGVPTSEFVEGSKSSGFRQFSGPKTAQKSRVWPGGIPRTVGFRVFPGPGRLETRPGHLGARWGALPGAVEVGSVLGRFFGVSSRKNGLVHPQKPTLERSPGFSPGPRATESTFRHRAATLERCAARPVVGSRHHSEPLTRL